MGRGEGKTGSRFFVQVRQSNKVVHMPITRSFLYLFWSFANVPMCIFRCCSWDEYALHICVKTSDVLAFSAFSWNSSMNRRKVSFSNEILNEMETTGKGGARHRCPSAVVHNGSYNAWTSFKHASNPRLLSTVTLYCVWLFEKSRINTEIDFNFTKRYYVVEQRCIFRIKKALKKSYNTTV